MVSTFGSPREQRICCWPDCFQPPAYADTELCDHHLHEVAIGWIRDNLDVVREVIDATPEHVLLARRARERTDLPRLSEQRRPGNAEAVVYYLKVRGSDRVKIGTTTNLRQRMVSLRADGGDLLATEPGGHDQEWRRHQQFAEERYGRREEFAMSDRLAAHIASLTGATVTA